MLFASFDLGSVTTSQGVTIATPPIYVVKDDVTQSIVLLIRGTSSFNDVIIDISATKLRFEVSWFCSSLLVIVVVALTRCAGNRTDLESDLPQRSNPNSDL